MKKQMKLNSGATRGAHAAQARALRERHHYSTFDVGRSMFEVQFVLNEGRYAGDVIY